MASVRGVSKGATGSGGGPKRDPRVDEMAASTAMTSTGAAVSEVVRMYRSGSGWPAVSPQAGRDDEGRRGAGARYF